MKSKIFNIIAVFGIIGLLFSACNKSDDLITADAKTGGLVLPTSAIPYKLGNTPTVQVTVDIPKGPAVTSIEVFNTYTFKVSDKTSNKVLLKTIAVNGENANADIAKTYSVTYANLIAGLKIDNVELPSNELLANIGDFWTLTYISVLSDGRRVEGSSKTTISVANLYAGFYQVTGTFIHPTAGPRPINEKKFLTPLSALTCKTSVGDLGSAGYFMDITVNQTTNDVTYSNGTPLEILATVGKRSYFDPVTKKFHLFYFYMGGTGPRVIEEVYTPL